MILDNDNEPIYVGTCANCGFTAIGEEPAFCEGCGLEVIDEETK
jgi:hypothetical protein